MRGRVFAAIVAVGFGTLSAPAIAQVFRFTVDGKVSYSDRPCGGNATKVTTEPGHAPERFVPVLQHEANMGRVAVSQSPAQVRQAWGEPTKRNIGSADGGNEEWI